MPPPKKAAKKAATKTAKKAAKKAAKHVDPKHHELKDLRRAYEHLGRVESLQHAVPPSDLPDVGSLITLAQQQLKDGHAANAADLLRAAEHLSFAAIAPANANQANVSEAVEQAIHEQYHHLHHKAKEHWDSSEQRHTEVASIYKRSLKAAKLAFDKADYREALERIRAAEALAHVESRGPDRLTGSPASKHLPHS